MRIGVIALGYGVAMVPASIVLPHRPSHPRDAGLRSWSDVVRSGPRLVVKEVDGGVSLENELTGSYLRLIAPETEGVASFPDISVLESDAGLIGILSGQSIEVRGSHAFDNLRYVWRSPKGSWVDGNYHHQVECYDWRTVEQFAHLILVNQNLRLTDVDIVEGACNYIWKRIHNGSPPIEPMREAEVVRVVESKPINGKIIRDLYFNDDPGFTVKLWFDEDQSAVYDNLKEILLEDRNVRYFMNSQFDSIDIIRLGTGLSDHAQLNMASFNGIGEQHVVTCHEGANQYAGMIFHSDYEMSSGRWIEQICDTFRGIVQKSSRMQAGEMLPSVTDRITSNEVHFELDSPIIRDITRLVVEFPEFEALMSNNPLLELHSRQGVHGQTYTDIRSIGGMQYYFHRIHCYSDGSHFGFAVFADTLETFKYEAYKHHLCTLLFGVFTLNAAQSDV